MDKMEEKIKEKTFEPVFVADEDVKIRTFLKNIKDEKDAEIILEKIILIKQNICDCGLSYKFRQGLLKHKQKCVIKKILKWKIL